MMLIFIECQFVDSLCNASRRPASQPFPARRGARYR